VIRANAAQLAGFLLEALTPALRQTISKDIMFAGFVQLLMDTDGDVRASTANAIVCLSEFAEKNNVNP
jgi:hypothetical protein